VNKLSYHLSGFSAIAQDFRQTADQMEQGLRQYGPTTRTSFTHFCALVEYLMPLKSFTTRFGTIKYRDWSLLISDMRGEYCLSDARFLSKSGSCVGMNVVALPSRREFALFDAGAKIRQVQSLDDGDRWCYREIGPLQPFEDLSECTRRPKRSRLSENAVKDCFSAITGLIWPSWTDDLFDEMIGIERSLKDIRQPVVSFETCNDLSRTDKAWRG
jgi:hypothetical protein